MNTATIDRASDRAALAELRAEERRQELQEQIAECINQAAKDLMQPGEECDPWTPDHIDEAIGNAPEGYRKVLFASLIEAKAQNLDNHHANHMALVALSQLVNRYWTEMAAHIANEKYGKNVDGLLSAAGSVC